MQESWEQLNISSLLANTLRAQGFEKPTAVQLEAIPALLGGHDAIVHAQTGTGKTLAYLLPLLSRISPEKPVVQAIVVAPTQELAMQIAAVADRLSGALALRTLPLIGGASVRRQLEKLKEKPHLIVGTPGRLRELLAARKLKVYETETVIVDEADQIFSLGETSHVNEVLKGVKRNCQIAFFSATYPDEMKDWEAQWLKQPLKIVLAPEQRVAPSILHSYIVCDQRDKADMVRRLLRTLDPSSALLFLNNTALIANWEAKLSYEGFTVEMLYGDADKTRRAATLKRFREGQCQLLLATDVAARGLDVENLPLVLQLELAVDADHYVHRAGRTGRMGKPGHVLSFVTPQERFIVEKLEKQLGIVMERKALAYGKLVPAEEVRGEDSVQREATQNKPQQNKPQQNKRSYAAKQTSKPNSSRISVAGKPGRTSERARVQKNKGAPKWLKAKREGPQP